MSYNTVSQICKAVAIMENLGETFTKKEFDNARPLDKSCSSIETLRSRYIVRIAEKEPITIKLRVPIVGYEVRIGTSYSKVTCSNLYVAKEIAELYSAKGFSIHIEEKEIWEIEGVRYHYVVDTNVFKHFLEKEKKDLEYSIQRKKEKIEVENRRLLNMMNIYQMIS